MQSARHDEESARLRAKDDERNRRRVRSFAVDGYWSPGGTTFETKALKYENPSGQTLRDIARSMPWEMDEAAWDRLRECYRLLRSSTSPTA